MKFLWKDPWLGGDIWAGGEDTGMGWSPRGWGVWGKSFCLLGPQFYH